MNVDILDSDGVIISTAAIDDGFWNSAAGYLNARIAPTGMALNVPGSNQPEMRVGNVGGFDAWVQSANVGAERRMRRQHHPHFGFGGHYRSRPRFGLGAVLPASAGAAAVSGAKETLAELAPMAAGIADLESELRKRGAWKLRKPTSDRPSAARVCGTAKRLYNHGL